MARTKLNKKEPTQPEPEPTQPEPEPTQPEPQLNKNNPMKNVFIANQHKGTLVVPRSVPAKDGGIHQLVLESLQFPAGCVTQVDVEIWENVKKTNQMVNLWLDLKMIIVVPNPQTSVGTIATQACPTPPEHLKTNEELELGENTTRIVRENVSEITI